MSSIRRNLLFFLHILSISLLLAILIWGIVSSDAALQTDFSRKNLPPSLRYPFGTDWMGRDMFSRTIAGLSMSLRIGVLTATVSAFVALVLGAAAAVWGKCADAFVSWLIDLVMGIPHILLLILIAFALGRGFWGVTIGIIFTHWMSLARLLRAEILQLRQSVYVQIAAKLGANKFQIAFRHMLPYLFPQFTVGLILLFPHAI